MLKMICCIAADILALISYLAVRCCPGYYAGGWIYG